MGITVIQSGRFPAPSSGITVVQTASSAASTTVTPGATPTNGNKVTIIGCSPSNPTGWTQPSGFTLRSNTNRSGWFIGVYDKTASGEPSSYTMTGMSTSNGRLYMLESTGTDVEDIDVAVGGDASTGLTNGPTATTTDAVSLAVSVLYIGNGSANIVWGNDFANGSATQISTNDNGACRYRILSSTQTLTSSATWTTARSANLLIYVYTNV